jgi:CheY-like chemotaxis protein
LTEVSDSPDARIVQRVVVVLSPEDGNLIDALRAARYLVVSATAERLDEVAMAERARLVVLDEAVPGALEAVARLRRKGPVPVVLLGVGADVGARALKSGADVILPRPVSPDSLVELLGSMVTTAFPSAPPPPRRRAPLTNPKIRPLSPVTLAALDTPVPRRPSPPTPVPHSSQSSMPVVTISTSSAPPVGVPGDAAMSSVQAWLAETPPGLDEKTTWVPPDVAQEVEDTLRRALRVVGADPNALELTAAGDDSLDELVPPELLEPLEGALDDDDDDRREGVTVTSGGAAGARGATERRLPRESVEVAALVPLPVDGDARLAGKLERFGLGPLLSAAWRVRATGDIVLREGDREWQLTVANGHLLSLHSGQADEQVGPLFARLGFVPQEAARFAAVPLGVGPRGAAMLAAQGYVAADALVAMLGRAAQEVAFDLLCLDQFTWEVRPRSSALSIPFPTRALDALLVNGARARIEPAVAYQLLGGDGTELSLRGDGAALSTLPLMPNERVAALAARKTDLATLVRAHGDSALPAMVALNWLQLLRVEGLAHALADAQVPPGPERTRLRALVEAATRHDLLVVLGVSAWATRRAAQAALEVRRSEVDTIRARFVVSEALSPVYAALDEAAKLLTAAGAWERYVAALRVVDRS